MSLGTNDNCFKVFKCQSHKNTHSSRQLQRDIVRDNHASDKNTMLDVASVDDVTHVCAQEFFAIVNTRYLNLSLRYVMVVSNVIGEEKVFCWELMQSGRKGYLIIMSTKELVGKRISSLGKS